MWRNKQTGEVQDNVSVIRQLYPNPTLPAIVTDEILIEAGWDVVILTNPPAYDPETHRAEAAGCMDTESGVCQLWAIVELSEDEIAAREAHKSFVVAEYLGTVRTMREGILNRLAGIGLAALVDDDQPTVAAVVAARRRLLDITKVPAALAAYVKKDAVALKAAIKAEYAAIVQSVPANLVNAFEKVDE